MIALHRPRATEDRFSKLMLLLLLMMMIYATSHGTAHATLW
jgi:hypothetical protein